MSLSSNAQVGTSVFDVNSKDFFKKENYLFIKSGLLLSSGIGLQFEKPINDSVLLGAQAGFYHIKNLKAQSEFIEQSTFDFVSVGLFGKYFFKDHRTNGVYLLAGVNSVQMDTRVDFKSDADQEKQDSQMGLQAVVGYRFVGRQIMSSKLIFDIGLELGNGLKGEFVATKNGINNQIESVEIQNGIALEINTGLIF